MEWSVEVSGELVEKLLLDLKLGPIYEDGTRALNEELIDMINGLRVEIFSNEHPPPHFRVRFQGESNDFTIRECDPMYRSGLKKYWGNIRRWHRDNKQQLIAFWNAKRPSGCPVGNYSD
jgi:Domain of unknown function (DUF4160)